MRSLLRGPLLLLASMAALSSPASGEKLLMSNSLNTCQQDSSFTASLFNVVYTPANNSANIDMVATSSVQGKVLFDLAISAYGYQFLRLTVDPCNIDLAGLCPMVAGKIPFGFNLPISESAAKQIPEIAYNIPDLDATVRVYVNLTATGESVACVEADISNGKTVDLLGVKWATAIIAGLALVSSAVVNGLGHSNTAAHVAANSLSLFGYFQAQAILGLTSVQLPPIVQSWTQDFQWSMGIIRVGFMQDIFTWYQRATGGTPSTIFDSLTTVSVQVAKRSLDYADTSLNLFKRGLAMMPRSAVVDAARSLVKRNNITTGSGAYIVYGIQRVAFRSKIETTNLFMTGLTFFCIFVVLTVLIVAAFKGICELFVRNKWMDKDKFLDFRNGWLTVLKGILFRVALIGFPQMAILCLWEFTQNDSPAEIVLAVFFFFGMAITLAWGASKVIRIARRSVAMHRNPAYILFSDPQALNKWGFLYIQFRASAFYFIAPVLGYTLIKAMFVAFSQRSSVAQAIGFVIVEAGALIAASVLRPWMDKSTNSFNIAICVVNFLNAIFLLIFSNVFGAPPLVVGVVGVVLFVLNAAFSLILLIMVIVSTTITFFRKNPDARYQVMADDRASFMKSQTQLTTTTELDALAATARGDKGGYKSHLDLDDDNESLSSEDLRRRADTHGSQGSYHQASSGPRSPVNPSMPLFPAGGQRPQSPFRSASPNNFNRSGSSLGQHRSNDDSSSAGYRAQNTASPWQRGAGYD
ncbi:transient receptor potential (TRP) ion channel domain-containing protein [Hirsutella rhossiliensis]|uniref:Transient receptor potential (TRP) ion channel domain-containing protein n=1 Tax=Hirsutella rhossiliensis TaxID=111463 RepID=A0A9P8SGD6_9HYPO|nr:transient receptor potential (TRP) ion channel domain-containing protein [Hirsutella rhossiliensis]KAH0961923.1 transient receptor potential (TRP) ion channel domain-containing protein [Hirsutella rhossiliensis]